MFPCKIVTANNFTSPTIYVDGAVTTTLNNKNWHHVVITTGTNVSASNVPLGVASSTYFGGTLDDPRMYNRALSSSEVTRLYQLGN
ncbi:MAG: LamG-like jellyroll fold domain-containing protein [bacterium]|nr:LamG-like jellyroll fold domain-containing protein [bacterium]